jgi:hypothetical protein
MKRCPQCNSVYEDEKIYCLEDGTSLVNEAFTLPSDFSPEDQSGEQETVIRNPPLVFDISNQNIPTQQPQTQHLPKPPVNPYAPNQGNFSGQVPSKPNRGCLKYSLFLLIGLLIGGGIVLGIMSIGFVYMNNSANENKNSNISETAQNTASNRSTDDKQTTGTHSEKNVNADQTKLNGRVIRNRAVLRSSPSSSAGIIDRLPKDDRIEIVQRKSSTSRWYQVECEHGSKGWIDGYSIEYTQ